MLILGLIVFILVLTLILILQAHIVTKNAIRLPEAIGKRTNIQNRNFSLLHIGESTVAGAGVDSIEKGLTYNVLRHLNKNNYPKLDWQILGKNGAKIKQALVMNSVLECPDILILTFGVNDTKGFTKKSHWLQTINQCVDRFSCSKTKVYFTAVPPMHKFPLLPPPLRYLLGLKAQSLDKSLKKLCKTNNCNNWSHIHSNIDTKPAPMAEDGFHPNSFGYKIWGEIIAENILQENSSSKFIK